MKLDSLKSLYIEELRDLYSAENQLVKALPKMAKAASTPDLQDVFRRELLMALAKRERLSRLHEAARPFRVFLEIHGLPLWRRLPSRSDDGRPGLAFAARRRPRKECRNRQRRPEEAIRPKWALSPPLRTPRASETPEATRRSCRRSAAKL